MTLLSKAVWVDGSLVLSPLVGRLLRLDFDFTNDHASTVIGEVEQLGRCITLVTAQALGKLEVKCSPPCDVFVGTCLAQLCDELSEDKAGVSAVPLPVDDTTLTIMAPSDGYLIFTDDAGRPYFKLGDRVQSKQNLALLELMKLRIAISYEGSKTMRFLAYDAISHQAIRKGQSICRLSTNEVFNDLMKSY